MMPATPGGCEEAQDGFAGGDLWFLIPAEPAAGVSHIPSMRKEPRAHSIARIITAQPPKPPLGSVSTQTLQTPNPQTLGQG